MQPPLPFKLAPEDDAGRRALTIRGRTYQVDIARHRGARRYVLRVTRGGVLRLTVPWRQSIAGGLEFVVHQAAWVERERARQLAHAAPWTDGTEIWFRGARVTLSIGRGVLRFSDQSIAIPPSADVRAAVEARLLAIARRELPPRLEALAAEHQLIVTRTSIRNQRSRWGACSARAAITLNWRLVQMPPSVGDYVILHELMHLKQANHSRRFWREVERVCPEWRDAERWIRRYGKDIL